MCRYEYNVSDLTHLYFDVIIMSDEFKREKRTRGDEWFQTFCQRQIFFVLAIADFMLNYTDKVQYETISYTPTVQKDKEQLVCAWLLPKIWERKENQVYSSSN